MNKLTTKERGQILAMMVEGMSIRSIARLTGASKNTIVKLLENAGNAFTDWQDAKLRDLPCKRIQCDEIWSFVKAKQKNATKEQIDSGEAGDIWTWTALCADTKLIASWAVGARDAGMAHEFMLDLADRLANRVQLTTDGLRLYIDAMEGAFGGGIDYAMLIKQFGGEPGWDAARRYSPAVCTGAVMKNIAGNPEAKHITTSHNERQKPFDADGHAPLYPANQWLQQEGREPRARGGDLLHALQLRPDSPDIARNASYGSRHYEVADEL